MITERNIERLKNIISAFALQDYLRANPSPKRDRKGNPKHNPYSLSPNTNEARGMLLLCSKTNITPSDEEKVKAYLLKMKTSGREEELMNFYKEKGKRK